MRSLILVSALAAATLALPAAAADRAQGRLHGFSEVPSVATTAIGRIRAVIREHDGAIDYELSYTGLEGEVRQAHIHFGQMDVNGGVMVFLCQTTFNADPTGLAPTCVQDGTVTGTLTSANIIGPAGQGVDTGEFAELVRVIRAGLGYANVHTTKYASGEVRGQISLKNE
jgi:hypothetical protein